MEERLLENVWNVYANIHSIFTVSLDDITLEVVEKVTKRLSGVFC